MLANGIPAPILALDDIPVPIVQQVVNHNGYQTISGQQLIEIIENRPYDQIFILDARFQYEFDGGHITGAINVTNRDQIPNIYNNCIGRRTCVICYCEFSQNRGPNLWQLIRSFDRENHVTDYPNLTIPDLFILEQGYRSFYENHPEFCVGGYIEMHNQR